jgi:hypothetical protein
VLFNTAAQRMFGIAAGEIEGPPLDRLIPAELREAHDHWMRQFAMQSGGRGAWGGPATKRADSGLMERRS